MAYASVEDLRSNLGGPPSRTPEYIAKMLHPVPETTVVDRAASILKHVTGKRVLEFGASGPMHEAVVKVAAYCYGVDREDGPGVVGFDLDEISPSSLLPEPAMDPDIILCGEVLEHLANPGYFLQRLKKQWLGVPVLITVPNAFSSAAMAHILRGAENVNIDHVAWYSYRTLRTLLERYGFMIEAFHWYGGKPYTAEGLLVVAR